MNKTLAMVALGTILVSGLVLVSALGNSAYAQSGKEVKVDIVKGATNMKGKAFAPNPLNVQPGTKVTWTNSDTAVHTVSSGTVAKPTKDFDSKVIGPKKTFSFTFAKEGTFDYYCMLHPTMVGKVTVDKKAPAAGGSTPAPAKADNATTKPAAGGKVVEIVKGATNMKGKAFAPNPIEVKAGDTVTWKNVDTAAHTVTSGTAKEPTKTFDSKIMGPKKEFSFKFEKKGNYDYYCMLHPTMVGKVTVK